MTTTLATALTEKRETIRSTIWQETAPADDPFNAEICRLRGYDVFGDLLGKISWIEYLYLLFFDEAPNPQQQKLLETIAIVLANPGPRDHGVQAAMNGAVGGSGSAACLMAALAIGAGGLRGGHELLVAMKMWQECGCDFHLWQKQILTPDQEERADVWPEMEHTPGFDPHAEHCSLVVRQALDCMAEIGLSSSGQCALKWLREYRVPLESVAKAPLSLTGLVAAAFIDLDLKPEQAEMLYLLLRLPGAAAHAMEQRTFGWMNFPFWKKGLVLTNDPAAKIDSENMQQQELATEPALATDLIAKVAVDAKS